MTSEVCNVFLRPELSFLVVVGVGRCEVLTIIMTLNVIVCLHDKIFGVIRKNELHYEPGQVGGKDCE